MTRPLALLVAALVAAVPAAAAAQNQGLCPGRSSTVNGGNQEMCFESTDVRADVTRSDLDALRHLRAMRGISLIRLRDSFAREMLKSVERL